MVRTIQKKIASIYSLWLFIVFILIIGYLLMSGNIFRTYADAIPWILWYIGLAVLGNIAALIAIYHYMKINKDGLTWVVVYEILFFAVLVLSYWVLAAEKLPGALGNINFETLLNAVLPITFILMILLEFLFSKGIRLMLPKREIIIEETVTDAY